MASFDLSYDADDDVLEVTFALFDEHFARTIPLNDHVVVYSDLSMRTIWGITLYSYSQLLKVGETEMTDLRALTEQQCESILTMLERAPASRFLEVLDHGELVARIGAPGIETLVHEP